MAPLEPIERYGRQRPHLSVAELTARHGAAGADIGPVEAFAAEAKLEVVAVDATSRCVRLRGTWAALGAAFGTSIEVYAVDGEEYYRNTTPISVPESLRPAVEAVRGLDTRRVIKSHGGFSSGTNALTVAQVIARYGFPSVQDPTSNGKGETVALLQFDSVFQLSQLEQELNGKGIPIPPVTLRYDLLAGKAQANNSPGEATLDAIIVAEASPGVHIVLWFSTGYDAATIQRAITAATTDPSMAATVLSMSYGDYASPGFFEGIDSAFQDAAALGITCINSSGDGGGQPQPVESPADCPHVLAVGGTVIEAEGVEPAGGPEVVWNRIVDLGQGPVAMASTGGFSPTFAPGAWQNGFLPPGSKRGVPDVSAHADSYGGWLGTSAAAPLWAALIAQINQVRRARGHSRLGLVAPDLYANASSFTDITMGDSGREVVPGKNASEPGYPATKGWDAATGLGTPNAALIAKLTLRRLAGVVKAPRFPVAVGVPIALLVHAYDVVTGATVEAEVLLDGVGKGLTDRVIPSVTVKEMTRDVSLPSGGQVFSMTFSKCAVQAAGYEIAPVDLGHPDVDHTTPAGPHRPI